MILIQLGKTQAGCRRPEWGRGVAIGHKLEYFFTRNSTIFLLEIPAATFLCKHPLCASTRGTGGGGVGFSHVTKEVLAQGSGGRIVLPIFFDGAITIYAMPQPSKYSPCLTLGNSNLSLLFDSLDFNFA